MAKVSWSGVKNHFRIAYVDGTSVDVTTGMADAIRWEKNNLGESLALHGAEINVLLRVAWYALRRQGLSDVTDFEEWVATVDDFGRVDDEADPDPTQPDQSAG